MSIQKSLVGACAVVAAMTATQVHGVVTDVRTIELIQNLNDTFQIAELQAFETGSGINVALQSNGGVASASSSGFGTVPGLGNDGNLAGNHPNAWHSNDAAGATFRVTLAAATSLDAVTIFGRTDCCQNRQDNFNLVMRNDANEVVFFQQVTGVGSSPGSTGTIIVESSGPIIGIPVNAAFRKPAIQSSEYPGFPAGNGTDGNLGNFTHTNSGDTNATWQVDLGATVPIDQIILNNRGGGCCPERLQNINVDILDRNGNVVQSFFDLNNDNELGSPAALTLDLPTTVRGQTVRVSRTASPGGGDANNVLSLGEVQVLATNLAPLGTVTQSSQLGGFQAGNAIDNNLGNFTHTASTDTTPSLTLDLGATRLIDSVILFNRGDGCCGERLRDITVDILAQDGLTVLASALLNSGGVLGAPAFLAVDLHALTGDSVEGRFVRVSRATLPGGGDANNVLSIGELQVFGSTTIPEPASAIMCAAGLLGLALRGRRSRA